MSNPSSKPKIRPGSVLAGKYRVERVLGEGGMGMVVAAEHLVLHEKVAIKFLLDDLEASDEIAERFLREARAAVRIKSEHVARVIDVGRLDGGAPFMVMEYLNGKDLAEVLEDGPLPVADACDYIVQACEAMSVAHQAGIVHRDLKPANLFLTRRPDGSPVVKVLDFGISKTTAVDSGEVSLTQTSQMMGSPLYMSPEQMRSTKDVDRFTDIWALGAILYELLTGRPPFTGETLGAVFAKVITCDPEPISGSRSDVPGDLEQVVWRCLAKSPEARLRTEELATALGPFASPRSAALVERLSSTLRSAEMGTANTTPAPARTPQRETPAAPFSQRTTGEFGPIATSTSWSDAREPAGKSSRNVWLVGAAATLVGLVGGPVWMLQREPHAPAAVASNTEPAETARSKPATRPAPPSSAAVLEATPASSAAPPESRTRPADPVREQPEASRQKAVAPKPAARPPAAVAPKKKAPEPKPSEPSPEPPGGNPLSIEFK